MVTVCDSMTDISAEAMIFQLQNTVKISYLLSERYFYTSLWYISILFCNLEPVCDHYPHYRVFFPVAFL